MTFAAFAKKHIPRHRLLSENKIEQQNKVFSINIGTRVRIAHNPLNSNVVNEYLGREFTVDIISASCYQGKFEYEYHWNNEGLVFFANELEIV